MIGLRKVEPPAVLVEKGSEWTEEYLAGVESGVWPSEAAKTRYRHPEIKTKIRQETADKCAYCEAKVTHVYPGDCEHILPKSRRPELVVDWENLTFVCSECNRRKSDYYEPELPLVNPYSDVPETHLRWYGPMVLAANGDNLGRVTIRLLELSRAPLVERRSERIRQLRNLVEVWESTEDAAYRLVLWKEIVREADCEKEYSACAKQFILQHLKLENLSDEAMPILKE
jgi:hypothetical protein